jgi:hypothetical protein
MGARGRKIGRRCPFKGRGGEAATGAGVSGKIGRHVEGSRRGPWLPPMGTARVARHGQQRPSRGARVHTVAGGTGSLTGGARMAAGGHGVERRGARVGRP